ncbi:DUF2892 domain-containing protein [Fontisubflavum oceani]|uniref:YgaP family membrane protein n=1 Tax=Fontisubflavum oceani TaxID=2978973 RepID=UPI0025B3D6C7|nr:DUF2892 domain-containing protein [Fontisubflavum oceani]WJY22266.1 DUF2892 domain-containing protein [Fontisubflavum oceani]
MGKLDRGLRLVAAALLLWVAFGSTFAATGLLNWLAIAVAAIFTITALLGNCPLYRIVGLKTCQDC